MKITELKTKLEIRRSELKEEYARLVKIAHDYDVKGEWDNADFYKRVSDNILGRVSEIDMILNNL